MDLCVCVSALWRCCCVSWMTCGLLFTPSCVQLLLDTKYVLDYSMWRLQMLLWICSLLPSKLKSISALTNSYIAKINSNKRIHVKIFITRLCLCYWVSQQIPFLEDLWWMWWFPNREVGVAAGYWICCWRRLPWRLRQDTIEFVQNSHSSPPVWTFFQLKYGLQQR